MSKGLEAIEQYKQVVCPNCQYHYGNKCQNKDQCFSMIIEKELKVLEIIKEKIWFDFDDNRLRVDIWTKSDDEMLLYSFICKDLQEYKLLKEVLL